MGPDIEVEISDTQGHLRVDPAALERLVRLVMVAEDRSRASISIAVVDNAVIHAVNRTHLGHDWPTDVISFPLSDPDDQVLTGELVVSAETACSSARELGVEPLDELALYVVHGLLHLCGFDDHDDADVRRMRKREGELISLAGLVNPCRPIVGADGAAEVEATCRPLDARGGGPRLPTPQPESPSWTG